MKVKRIILALWLGAAFLPVLCISAAGVDDKRLPAHDAIERIKQIALESKQYQAGIGALEGIAKRARKPSVKQAAVFAIADLYIAQGKHREAMAALAKLADVGNATPPPVRLNETGVLRWLQRHPEAAERIVRRLRRRPVAGVLQLEPVPAMSVSHVGGGVVAHKGKLYVWSGYTQEGRPHFDRTDRLEIFDPKTGKWSRGAPLPGMRSSLGTFVLKNRLYSIGGEQNPSGRFSNTVHRYDPTRDKWTEMNPFPTRTWDPMCAVCGGKAYVFGGRRGYGRTYGQTYVYNERADKWIQRAGMPVSVMLGGVAVVGRKIYVFGGHHKRSEPHGRYLKIVQIYDPARNKWTTQPMPTTLHTPAAVVHRGDVWLFSPLAIDGDTGKTRPCRYAYRFSPARGRWAKCRIDYPKGMSVQNDPVVIDGKVYFTQFQSGSRRTTKVMRADLAPGRHATPLRQAPAGRPSGTPHKVREDSD